MSLTSLGVDAGALPRAESSTAMHIKRRLANMCFKSKEDADEEYAWYWHAACRAPVVFAMAAFLSPYITQLAKFSMDSDGKAHWLGIPMLPTSYVAVLSTVAILLTAMLSPLLGTVADYTSLRKKLLITFNTIGAVAAVLMVTVTHSTWWLGGLIFIVVFFCYEATLTYIYAYLPDVSSTPQRRSYISAMAILYGNGAQVAIAIVLTLIVFLAGAPQLDPSNPSFEDSDISDWGIARVNESGVPEPVVPCPAYLTRQSDSAFLLECKRVSSGELRGKNALRVRVSDAWLEAGGNGTSARLMQTSDDDADVYQDKRLLLITNIKGKDLPSSPSARAVVSVSSGEQVSRAYGVSSSYETPHVFRQMGSSETGLAFGVSMSQRGTYFIDDIQALVESDFLRALAVSLSGLWWGFMAIITFRNLRSRKASHQLPPDTSLLAASLARVATTFRHALAPENKQAFRFLLCIVFYSAGLNAVIALTSPFLQEQLRLTPAMIGVVLVAAQILGIAGAALFHFIGKHFGMKQSFLIVLALWTCIPITGGLLLHDESDLPWLIPITLVLGLALGGGITVVRAMFAGMVVKGQEAEFMGMFSLASKIFAWSGTLVFAFVNEATDDTALAFVVLSVFFALAFIALLFVDYDERRSSSVDASPMEPDHDKLDPVVVDAEELPAPSIMSDSSNVPDNLEMLALSIEDMATSSNAATPDVEEDGSRRPSFRDEPELGGENNNDDDDN